MFRFITLFAILWGGLITAAIAETPLKSGFYMGGSVGYAEFDDDDAFESNDGNFGDYKFDDSDFGWGILAGYKFFEYFAVEARFTDTGDYDLESRDGSAKFDVETDVLSAHAIGILPLNNGWSLYGQIGVGNVTVEVDPNSDEDETALSYGIGAMYHASRDLSFGFQADAYSFDYEPGTLTNDNGGSLDVDDTDALITTVQLVVRYTF